MHIITTLNTTCHVAAIITGDVHNGHVANLHIYTVDNAAQLHDAMSQVMETPKEGLWVTPTTALQQQLHSLATPQDQKARRIYSLQQIGETQEIPYITEEVNSILSLTHQQEQELHTYTEGTELALIERIKNKFRRIETLYHQH